jgi:hypothetical protein
MADLSATYFIDLSSPKIFYNKKKNNNINIFTI